MNRRKTKRERELVADISKATQVFCDSYYDPKCSGCNNCPLHLYLSSDCRENYVQYLLRKEEKEHD